MNMRKLPVFIGAIFLLYLIMQGWNTTMYRQFPSLVIANYWTVAAVVLGGWFFLRVLRVIR